MTLLSRPVLLRAALVTVAAAALAGATSGTAGQTVPRDAPYDIDRTWGKLPDGRSWGSSSAVAVDRDGNVWIAERCGQNSCAGRAPAPVLKFTPRGEVLRTFGENMFVRPHGLHIDRDGNVWITDGDGAGGKGHQVFKFSPEGKLLLTLGTAGVAGDSPTTFNQPSDVAITENGDIFVADGHGGDSNARIVKFSKSGTFIKAWGKKGTARGELDDPHAIEIDSRGRLFVADRQNNRIQIFDQNGNVLDEWRQFGRPSGLSIDRNDVLYVSEADSGVTKIGRAKGIWIGSAKDGSVKAFISDPDGNCEGIAADAAGTVYCGEVASRRVKKFTKK